VRKNLKYIALVFVISFFLNLIWENLHSPLYLEYKGGNITQIILLWVTFTDAVYITTCAFFVLIFTNKRLMVWISMLILLSISIFLEKWALGTGRWAYNSMMPIIPFLNIGLTPTIQLVILGYFSFKFSKII